MNLLNLLLPNQAFRRSLQRMPKGQRLRYWAIRIAMALIAVLAILLFKVQQHPQLH